MKLLAASDIHGNHAVYKWLVHKANATSVDALVLAGDLIGSLNGYDTIEEAQRQDASTIVTILQGMNTYLPYKPKNFTTSYPYAIIEPCYPTRRVIMKSKSKSNDTRILDKIVLPPAKKNGDRMGNSRGYLPKVIYRRPPP